jgi:hypothetical protein
MRARRLDRASGWKRRAVSCQLACAVRDAAPHIYRCRDGLGAQASALELFEFSSCSSRHTCLIFWRGMESMECEAEARLVHVRAVYLYACTIRAWTRNTSSVYLSLTRPTLRSLHLISHTK